MSLFAKEKNNGYILVAKSTLKCSTLPPANPSQQPSIQRIESTSIQTNPPAKARENPPAKARENPPAVQTPVCKGRDAQGAPCEKERGLSGVNLSRKRLANLSLSCSERSVILGGLLGDGSLKIYPGYKNARYSIRHSEKQSTYFFYKVNLLSALNSGGSVQRQKADGWSLLGKLRYQSRALTALTQIHNVTHKKNKLRVKRKWLNHLTAHSLAIWWFDDGSIIGKGRKGVLCTDGFSEAECLILAKYLLLVWKIRARVGKVSKQRWKEATLSCARIENGSDLENSCKPKGLHSVKNKSQDHDLQGNYSYRLYLSTEQLKLFLKIILPHLPCKEMFYKVLLIYKDLRLQERWISEVEKGCPQEERPFLASSFQEMKNKLRK